MATTERTEAEASVVALVDALVLYDAPILDRRFFEMLERYPDAGMRARLAAIPDAVVEGAKATMRSAFLWESSPAGGALARPFLVRAERTLLKAFLHAAEEQAALKAFLARNAPTAEVRDEIDRALDLHRDVIATLREAVDLLGREEGGRPARFVGEETERSDLRGDVERAVRRLRATGRHPDRLVLSHTALRHLRDQGCFRGTTTFDGVPVVVDLAWDAPKFALLSREQVPVEAMHERG